MSHMFGGGGASVPAAPAPAPPAPTAVDPAVQQAAAELAATQAQAVGRESTILTAGAGTGSPATQQKTLLGN